MIHTSSVKIKFPLLWNCCETLVLAAGLTDIISRMPTPPGKMKKTNYYVQWQQLKQLHKATYVGSYKPLVSRVGLCVSAELWTFLTEPYLAQPKTQPTQTGTNRWKGLTQWAAWQQDTGLCDCALVKGWPCVYTVCIFQKFTFVFGVRAACV